MQHGEGILGKPGAPFLARVHAFREDLGLLRDQFLPDRGLVERNEGLDVRIGEVSRVNYDDQVVQVLRPHLEIGRAHV